MKLAISSLLLACGLSAADPLIGAWTLNFEKSPGVTQQISKFDRDGEFFTNTNGPIKYRFKMDGKEYPSASEQFDAVVWRQAGPRKYDHETRKGGKIVYMVATEVAANGLTRSYKHTRYLDNGQTVVTEGVQERIGGETDPAMPLIGHWRLRQVSEWKQAGKELQYRAGAFSYSAAPDGKDYPATGSQTVDAVSLRRPSPNSIEITGKKAGKVIYTITQTVSADGKTLSGRSTGRGDVVFERTK